MSPNDWHRVGGNRMTSMSVRLGAFFLSFLIAAFSSGGQAAEGARSVHVRGSTIFLPAMQMLAERYMAEHPGSRIVVLGGGTWWGVKTVLDRSAGIGMVSGETIPDELTELAEDEGLILHRAPVARFAVVPIVHPSNPIADLTPAQLHDIYVGRIANWKEVGGPDRPIHVVASEDAMAGIFQVWASRIMGGTVVTAAARTVQASQIDAAVARDPAAIGYQALGRLVTSVKALKVAGIAARLDAIADGTYPVVGDLSLAYIDPLPAPAKEFLDYCLGEAGRAESVRLGAAYIGDRR